MTHVSRVYGKRPNMNSVGERLREERRRLGLTQDQLACLAGVTRRAQTRYETDANSASSTYFSAVAEVGIDVLYVLTGKRAVPVQSTLTNEELALLDNYRHSSREDQAALRRMGLALSKPPSSKQRNGTTGGE